MMIISKRSVLSLVIALSMCGVAWAIPSGKGATSFTGGTTSSLDSINGGELNDEDTAFVVLPSGGTYWYTLDETSGLAENSPYVIAPDTNAGNKRWICTNCGNSSQPGDVEIATEAEAGALSSTVLVLTPGTLNSAITNATLASNSSIGVTQIAPVGNSTDYSKALSAGGLFDTQRFYSVEVDYATALGNGTQSVYVPFTPVSAVITATATAGTVPYFSHTTQYKTSKVGVRFQGDGTLFYTTTVSGYSAYLANYSATLITLIQVTFVTGGATVTYNINTGTPGITTRLNILFMR